MKLIAAIFILLAGSAFGTNHYIRTGAAGTGTGADWTNAYASFTAVGSTNFVRGDTYYVATGTYAEDVLINSNVSGTTRIYFKKATVADHGTATGWSDSYGTGVATMQTLDLDKGYVSFDGVSGSGTSGHGFHVYRTSTAAGNVVHLSADTTSYSLQHMDIEGAGYASSAGAIVGVYYSTGSVKGTYIAFCWIHQVTTNGIGCASQNGTSYADYGMLFENNVVSETGGCTDDTNHGQGMQFGGNGAAYCIVRNNVFKNIIGSAMVAFLIALDNTVYNEIQIYNNVFYLDDPVIYNVLTPGPIWSEDIKTHTGCTLSNVAIANNSFYNITGAGVRAQIVLETSTAGNSQKNSIYEGCHFTSGVNGLQVNSNNGYWNSNGTPPSGTTNQVNGSATTFTNAATYDFTLLVNGYAVGVGLDLTSTFTTFADGSTRTAPWSLGSLPVSGSGVSGSGASGTLILSGVAHLN